MEPPGDRKLSTKPVRIEDNVWIGEYVTVLAGVTIGKGSIIGALSVVTSNIPPYAIAVGIPAKVIKIYNEEKKIWEKV
jgi:lipopolysaccharide O-acetyltransferase